jgi:pimeloyl-ACP methyl ester carboxylesterase
MSRKAIYCICGEGGGKGGPNLTYFNLEKILFPHYTVIHHDTIKRSVSLNVASLLELIKSNIDTYDEIYLIGWDMGCSVAIQSTYFIHNLIKYNYVKGLILSAPQWSQTELIDYIDVPIIFIHGTNDKISPCSISQRMFNKYKYTKQINLIENQNHGFLMKDSDLATIVAQYFFM